MSTEVPPAAPAANPTHPAPMAPPIGNFVAKSKESLAKHDRNAVPTAAPAATPPAEPPKSPMGETSPTIPATPAATDKPTDKPTATQPEGDDIPENFSNAKAENWKKLREIRTRLEGETKTLRDQLKSKDDEIVKFKTKPEIPKEVEERIASITKERDEFSTRLERLAIEQHPKFQAHFQSRLDQAIESAKAAAGPKADQVLAILEAPASKWRKEAINALYAEMEAEGDKYALAAAIQEYDRTRAERSKTLENHKEEAKRLKLVEADNEVERRKQLAAAHELLYQEALKVADGFDSFKGDDGQTHKTTLQKFVKGEATKDAYMQTVSKGIDYDRLQKHYEALAKERDELKAAVAEYQNANPGMRTGAGSQTNAPAKVKTHYGESAFMGEVIGKLQRGPGK